MKPPTPPAAESALTALADTACYLVMPNSPRDVWYGVPAAPESYQLVCFVESRHSHINPSFDAQYLADALNEKAGRSNAHAAAQQRIAELERALESSSRVLALSAEILKDGPHTGKIKYLEQQIERNRLALRHPERT